MPTYEYECNRCGKIFEVFQQMNEPLLSLCPDKKCKGSVKRLISKGAGFIFKGQGFYATDYRSEDYKKRAKEDQSLSANCQNCEKNKDCSKV